MSQVSGIAMDNLTGILNYSLTKYKDPNILNVTQKYQRYVFMDEIFRQNKYDTQGGTSVTFHIVTDSKGNSRHINYLEAMDINIQDPSIQGSAPWAMVRGSIEWNRIAMMANKGDDVKILDYMKVQQFRAKAGHINEIEQKAPLAPETSTDTRNPRGLGYWLAWLPSGTTDYTGGFNGTTAYFGDATTTTTIGGISRTANPETCNWVANHNGINPQTFDTMQKALNDTGFVRPRDLAEFESDRNRLRKILMSLDQKTAYDQIRNKLSNGGRNGDVNPYGSTKAEFGGIEVCGLATLNGVSYDPIYIVDFAHFYPILHSNWLMKTDEVMQKPLVPDIYFAWMTTWYNYCCDNPRSQAVLHRVR